MPINFERTRDWLRQFDFQRLFVEALGWSRPARKAAWRRRETGGNKLDLPSGGVAERVGIYTYLTRTSWPAEP